MERYEYLNGPPAPRMVAELAMRHDVLVKQLADAQATIAALEETILKMGEQAAVVAKDAMAAKEQVAALQADNRTYINERHENMKQIEQLQARVKELEAQHEDLAQRNRILRHRPDLPIERTEFHDQFAALQSQLTQRTAELQTARCDAVRAFVRGEDKMCLVCGAKEPCELNNDPSSPCTFEPTPMELLKALQQRTAELEAAKADFVDASTDRDDWITSWRVLQRYNERIEAELERVRGERDKLQSEVDGWELGSRGFP